MIDLTINDLDQIKLSKKSILLIWANGCHACSLAKPMYAEIESHYPEFEFYKLEFSSEIMEFYNKNIPKELAKSQLKNLNGEVLKDDNGLEIIKYEQDELGNLVRKAPISFPNFLIFNNSAISETNEHGFLGNIAGFNPEAVRYVLDQLSIQTQVV